MSLWEKSISEQLKSIQGYTRLGVLGERAYSGMVISCQFLYILHLNNPQNGSEMHFCLRPWKQTIWPYLEHRFVFTIEYKDGHKSSKLTFFIKIIYLI